MPDEVARVAQNQAPLSRGIAGLAPLDGVRAMRVVDLSPSLCDRSPVVTSPVKCGASPREIEGVLLVLANLPLALAIGRRSWRP
jgi:hypothetical protein